MTPASSSPRHARLIELFSAIQGEGLNVGTRQLFIRFATCDLRCWFCDSARTWRSPATCQIEKTPGGRDFESHPNPVGGDDLLAWIERQNVPGLHDSISLTGGEPLLHSPFLAGILPEIKRLTGLPIYLETGGHRPAQLAAIASDLDLVGMDIKLPSVSGETHWEEHGRSLQLCRDAQLPVFVKVIISDRTDARELERTAQLVAEIDPEIEVFLQPVTLLGKEERARLETEWAIAKQPLRAIVSPPSPDRVLAWQGLMKRTLKRVRVVPQTHKMLGQL